MSIPSNLNPATTAAWVDELPYANKPLVARETFEIIQGLPEARLPPKQQIAVLETIEHPVNVVLEHIRNQLSAGHSSTDQFLRLGEAYCQKVIAIGETLAENCCKKGGLRITDRLPRRGLAVVNHYFEQWNLLRALDHRPAPEGLWQRVKEINSHAGPKRSPALARLIAFQLASPMRLTCRQIHDLNTLLKSLPMDKLVHIGQTGGRSSQTGFFLPAGDAPPEYGPIPADSVPVDLRKLVISLESSPPHHIAPSLLKSLLDRWAGKFADKQPRIPTNRPLQTSAVIGLGCIVRHLNQQKPALHQATAAPAGYRSTSQPNPFTSRNKSTEVSFLDISDGGCRIRTDWQGVKTGDIIAIFWGRVEWRIGSIVWMVNDGGRSECGVQWLMNQPRAVLLRFDTGEPVQGLVGQCLLGDHQALLYRTGQPHTPHSCLVKSTDQWEPFHLSLRKSTGLVELARAERADDIPALSPTDPDPVGDDETGLTIAWTTLSPFPENASAS